MIDGIKIGPQTLRMTTRAMMALEQLHDCTIDEVLTRMSGQPRVSFMVPFLAECLNDGAGGTVEEASVFIDEVGYAAANAALGRAVTAAFAVPEGIAASQDTAPDGRSAKN